MKYLLSVISTLCIYGAASAQVYWQQHVDTKLDVRLDDKLHLLHGYEEFDYTNNSPDTLKYIYIHLWPNAYMHDHTPFAEQEVANGSKDFSLAKAKDRGYIDSLQFEIDGLSADYHYTEVMPDVARIDLPKPLLPKGRIHVTTPFMVKIPKIFSRQGHTKQAYFISQWFPKPAVYDKKGWHPIPYLDQGEFYSEIGTYDVSITLPKNYIVMATGNSLDANEEQWLDSLSTLNMPSDTLYKKGWPKSEEAMKTLHYHETNIHDFAWFADKRWIVRKDTVHTPDRRVVKAYAAFLPEDKETWIKATDYLKSTVEHYGKYVGIYPYNTIKAVEGDMHAGGGMEYPTVTIIDRGASSSLQTVIVHEAGHNWFYGILATNERDHAWMDEGMNTFYEHKTVNAIGKETVTAKAKGITFNISDDLETMLYYMSVAAHTDQALEQSSAAFSKLNYGGDVYYKTGLMLKWLEQYMGEDNFNAGMHEYFDTWKHKHPYPEDLQAIMQKHSSKSLDWFFKDILHTEKGADYAIRKAHKENGITEVNVRNRTGLLAPVRIDAYNKDSIIASAWSEPFTGSTTLQISNTDWTKLRVSNDIPDAKRANNVYHRRGLKLGLLLGLNRSEKEKFWVLPALGYNNYDGFQLGLAFHNITLPENRFRFTVAPMYGFKDKQFTGAGSVGYIWFSNGLFKDIMLQADAKTFNYNSSKQNIPTTLNARYIKVAPSLTFTFNEHDARSPVTRRLLLKAYGISEDNFNFTLDPADSLYRPSMGKQQQHIYGLLRYTHNNERTFNPFSYSVEGLGNADFAKINLEGNVRIDYMKKNKALYVRGYFGKFFAINSNPAVTDRYILNSTFTGANDYLYDDTYIGRSDVNGFAAHQISMREGGFKVPTPLYSTPFGRNDNWLAAVNIKSDLPLGKIPIRLFLDVGTYADAAKQNASANKFIFDGGVEIHALYDIISVYVPLLMSKDFRDYRKAMYGNNWVQNSIVFSIQLQNINWLRAPARVLKVLAD